MTTSESKSHSPSRFAHVLVTASAIVLFAVLMVVRSEVSSLWGRAVVAGVAFGVLAGGLAWTRVRRQAAHP